MFFNLKFRKKNPPNKFKIIIKRLLYHYFTIIIIIIIRLL